MDNIHLPEDLSMIPARGSHKVERVTLTLVPSTEERTFPNVPSTFSPAERLYQWRHASHMNYMIVPKRISSREIQVELFVDSPRKGKSVTRNVQKVIQDFVKEKIGTEWRGLRLGAISRPTASARPKSAIVRGTIEEILGSTLDG